MFHERLLRQLGKSLWNYRWRKLEVSKVWSDGGDIHILLQDPITPNVDAPLSPVLGPLTPCVTAREIEEELFVLPKRQRYA